MLSLDERYAFLGGNTDSAVQGDSGSEPVPRVMIAKYDLTQNFYIWAKTININSDAQFVAAQALSPDETSIGTIVSSKGNRYFESYLLYHDAQFGSMLQDPYQIQNMVEGYTWGVKQLAFDVRFTLWMLQQSYNNRLEGDNAADKGLLTSFALSGSIVMITGRIVVDYTYFGALHYVASSDVLLIGGASATYITSYAVSLYKQDASAFLTPTSLTQVDFYYDEITDLYSDQTSYQFIEIISHFDDQLYPSTWFVTNNRKTTLKGLPARLGRIAWDDTTLTTFAGAFANYLFFQGTGYFDILALQAQSDLQVIGFAAGQGINYIFAYEYYDANLEYFEVFSHHKINAVFLSNTLPNYSLDSSTYGHVINTGYIVGDTLSFDMTFDGPMQTFSQRAAFIQSLRGQNCGNALVMNYWSELEQYHFDEVGCLNLACEYYFNPLRQTAMDDPYNFLNFPIQPTNQFDIFMNEVNPYFQCNMNQVITAVTDGSFGEQYLPIWSDLTLFPLSCSFTPPTPQTMCTSAFPYYSVTEGVQQIYFGPKTVSVDSLTSKIQFNIVDSMMPQGDYPVTVYAQMPQSGGFYTSQFTFMVRIRSVSDTVACNSVMPCNQSMDLLTLTGSTVLDQTYIIGDPAVSLSIPMPTFTPDPHPHCSLSDLIQTLTVSLPISFVTYDTMTNILSFSTTNTADVGVYTISILQGMDRPISDSSSVNSVTVSFTLTVADLTTCQTDTLAAVLTTSQSEDQTYTYTDFEGFVQLPAFTLQPHTTCLASDIVYSMTAVSTPSIDTQWIVFDQANMQVKWFSEIELQPANVVISVTATIVQDIGDVTATNSFTLVCLDLCSQAYPSEPSPTQSLVYWLTEPKEEWEILVEDRNNGKCLPNWTYKLFIGSDEVPKSASSTDVFQVEFDPVTRVFGIFATETTSFQVELILKIYLKSTLIGENSYDLNIYQNSAPIFQDIIPTDFCIPPVATTPSWSYTLPEAMDPEGHTFTTTVSLTSSFINFASNTFSTVVSETAPLAQAVPATITLTDQKGAAQTYSLKFNLECAINEEPSPVQEIQTETTSTQTQDETSIQISEQTEEEFVYEVPKGISPFIPIIIPIPSFSHFTNTGQIIIQWPTPMKMTTSGSKSGRILSQTSQVQLKYIQKSDQEWIPQQDLDFSYSTDWKDEQHSVIKIQFKKPEFVSADTKAKDKLVVTFNDTQAFISQAGLTMPRGKQFEVEIPKQIGLGEIAFSEEQLQTIDAAAANTARLAVAMTFLTKAIANQLLGAIKNLTVVVHMFILELPYPVNTANFFAALFPLIAFEIFDADTLIFQPYLGFDSVEQGEVNEQFSSLGYENILVISNLNSLLLIMLVIPTQGLVALVVACFMRKKNFGACFIKIRKWADDQKASFLNKFADQVEKTYLIIMIMAFINVCNLKFEGVIWVINSLFSLFVAIGFGIFPFYIARKYKKRLEHSYDRDIYEKQNKELLLNFGNLIQDYNVCRIGKNLTILTVLVQFAKQFFFVLSIFIFLQDPVFTIFAFTYIFIFYLSFMLVVKPFYNPKNHKLMLFDNYTLLLTAYYLFGFTDWTSFQVKSMLGNQILLIIILQCGIMIGISIYDMMSQCSRKIKRKWLYFKWLIKPKVQTERFQKSKDTDLLTTTPDSKPFKRKRHISQAKQVFMSIQSFESSDSKGAQAIDLQSFRQDDSFQFSKPIKFQQKRPELLCNEINNFNDFQSQNQQLNQLEQTQALHEEISRNTDQIQTRDVTISQESDKSPRNPSQLQRQRYSKLRSNEKKIQELMQNRQELMKRTYKDPTKTTPVQSQLSVNQLEKKLTHIQVRTEIDPSSEIIQGISINQRKFMMLRAEMDDLKDKMRVQQGLENEFANTRQAPTKITNEKTFIF